MKRGEDYTSVDIKACIYRLFLGSILVSKSVVVDSHSITMSSLVVAQIVKTQRQIMGFKMNIREAKHASH